MGNPRRSKDKARANRLRLKKQEVNSVKAFLDSGESSINNALYVSHDTIHHLGLALEDELEKINAKKSIGQLIVPIEFQGDVEKYSEIGERFCSIVFDKRRSVLKNVPGEILLGVCIALIRAFSTVIAEIRRYHCYAKTTIPQNVDTVFFYLYKLTTKSIHILNLKYLKYPDTPQEEVELIKSIFNGMLPKNEVKEDYNNPLKWNKMDDKYRGPLNKIIKKYKKQ